MKLTTHIQHVMVRNVCALCFHGVVFRQRVTWTLKHREEHILTCLFVPCMYNSVLHNIFYADNFKAFVMNVVSF
jgi:predicted membrane protein